MENAGLEDRQGCHAVLHHEHKFPGLSSVLERADIGSQGHRHTSLKLLAKFPRVQIEHLMTARGLLRRWRVISKIFRDCKCRYGKNLFFPHQAHRLVAELVGVVDRNDARARRIESAWFPGRVDGDTFPYARRFLDSGAEFGLGVLISRRKLAIAE